MDIFLLFKCQEEIWVTSHFSGGNLRIRCVCIFVNKFKTLEKIPWKSFKKIRFTFAYGPNAVISSGEIIPVQSHRK